MKLPELRQPQRYVGLYVFDFGDHVGVGFTAQEVAELLESERTRDCKVYKIHRARPDGTVELKGMPRETFQLEAGLFFHAADDVQAKQDTERLLQWAQESPPPCRAKVHRSRLEPDGWVTALIYPAEYDDEVSRWLLDGNFRTAGAVDGGIDAVSQYHRLCREVAERHQLFGQTGPASRTGEELLRHLKVAVQR